MKIARGREESIRRRHPWLFTGSLAPGDTASRDDGLVEARAQDGAFLARGFASPRSSIAARFWTFEDRELDEPFVRSLVVDAARLRERLLPKETDGYRLINAEGDFLPGLVVDRYGPLLVVQATTEGTERARSLWLPALRSEFSRHAIYQKNDLPTREGEGLTTDDEWLTPAPENASEALMVPFQERGLRFIADVRDGQKTGFFLDQRENRALVRTHSAGLRVLNLFAYSGAFGVAALAGGAAYVENVDVSENALLLAKRNHAANASAGKAGFVTADVFDDLRRRIAARETWDLIITDPPAFAKKRSDVDRACRGYKDINRLALSLLSPRGMLLACSCSGPISRDLLQKVLFSAALDAGVRARILGHYGAGEDHPVSIDCPEGEYLKAFHLARV